MPKLQERTIKKKGKPSTSYLVTLPKELISKLKWKGGDWLTISVSPDSDVVIQNLDRKGKFDN